MRRIAAITVTILCLMTGAALAQEGARLLPEFIQKDKDAPDASNRKWQGPVFAAAQPPVPDPPPAQAKAAITDKKQCKAAGFTWSHGTCSAKDAK